MFLAAFLFPFVTQLLIVRVPAFAEVFNISQASYAQFGMFIMLSALVLVGIRGVKKMIRI
jgi:hypothetical protein